jgi:hypothetical protein
MANEAGRPEHAKTWQIISTLVENETTMDYQTNNDSWDPGLILSSILDYYGHQGDVQMCSLVYLVVGDLVSSRLRQAEEWMHSYIGLLNACLK